MHQLELDLIGGENPKNALMRQIAVEIVSDEVTEEVDIPIQLELDLQVT